jgi:hypothetical protein
MLLIASLRCNISFLLLLGLFFVREGSDKMEMTHNELVSIIRNMNVMDLGKELKLPSILAWGIHIFVRALQASSSVDRN